MQALPDSRLVIVCYLISIIALNIFFYQEASVPFMFPYKTVRQQNYSGAMDFDCMASA